MPNPSSDGIPAGEVQAFFAWAEAWNRWDVDHPPKRKRKKPIGALAVVRVGSMPVQKWDFRMRREAIRQLLDEEEKGRR